MAGHLLAIMAKQALMQPDYQQNTGDCDERAEQKKSLPAKGFDHITRRCGGENPGHTHKTGEQGKLCGSKTFIGQAGDKTDVGGSA